jgi:hypothetical protein
MKELHGPNGYALRILRRTDALLEMEASYTGAGDLPPVHLHPAQAEHFEVLEGAVRAVVGGEERVYGAGETFDVPANTPHTMTGNGPARTRWEVRPALRTDEFFERLYSGEAAKDFGAFLEEFSAEFRLAQLEP